MINYCIMFIIFGIITAAAFVGGCFVHPASVVVTVGERVFLTCSANEGDFITSYYIPIDNWQKTTVYTAPLLKPDGTIRTSTLAEGYFVTKPADNETTLQMNTTILSQAGLYVCTCASQRTAASTVVVLDSEPKFSTIYSVTYGEPVTFSCSMSFNASSDVSCELKIADESGSTAAKENDATVNDGLTVCHLKHTIIANASSDQWYTCNVTLSTKGSGVIYSRVLKATVQWQPISSTTDFLSSENSQAVSGSYAYQLIALPTGIAVAFLIIAILSAATIVLYKKLKQRRSSDAVKISTEDSPALYAALDVQTSSEKRQRETYTAIQLPIQSQQDPCGDYMNTDFSCEYETVN